MANKSIHTRIKCENLAPFTLLEKELNTNMLRIGIFANNGSGKTFLSRMFRLLEKDVVPESDGTIPTDYLVRFGCNKASFSFSISDDSGMKEDIHLDIHTATLPQIPKTNYIYHTFTHDYVEENIRALNYEKKSNITGYILGKTNIDLSDEESKLKQIFDDGIALKQEIETYITEFKNSLSTINLSRLNEFKTLLSIAYILDSDTNGIIPDIKSFEATIEDYNKVKAIPENLEDIPTAQLPEFDFNLIEEIVNILSTEYSVSQIAESFKADIHSKETFIETGLKLYNLENKCPFCGQIYNTSAIELINRYVAFFNDTETKTIKLIKTKNDQLKNILNNIIIFKRKFDIQQATFDKYKNNYIPSFDGQQLVQIDSREIEQYIIKLSSSLECKIKALSVSIVSDDILDKLKHEWEKISSIIQINNALTAKLNARKNKISAENISIRRDICRSAYNYLAISLKEKIIARKQLLEEYKNLSIVIQKKKEQEKASKKEKVAETICKVLDYFFAGKYTLNPDNFQLVFNSRELKKGQTRKVLSEGEKSIIAFAYYLGDTHIKVNRDEEYSRLFFIIDDPISSMDFSYVYSLSGVIREIHNILPKIGNRYRYIIFTHNNDFMRILNENNIITTALLLSQNTLDEFNVNFSVPYISHLIDIYKVARKNVKATHTTPNSIRHIIETLTKFYSIRVNEDSIAEYIRLHIPNDKKTYTMINDLSHGGWRSEQSPITDKDYIDICEEIVCHIEKVFPKQIEYCASVAK